MLNTEGILSKTGAIIEVALVNEIVDSESGLTEAGRPAVSANEPLLQGLLHAEFTRSKTA